jgi:hypothetical protein
MVYMGRLSKLLVAATVLSFGVISIPDVAHAEDCQSYSEAPSSSSPVTFTILDTDVGTDAYQRLLTYSKGGHKALGMAIASSYDYFGKCQYPGIGIMDGSGGNGFRPNYTLAIWSDWINLSEARSAIYSLIGAGSNPTVTNGDCNISCDGTTGRQFDGTIVNETTTTTTVTPTTQVSNEPVTSAPATEQQEEVVQDSTTEPVTVDAPQAVIETTTTTTVAPVSVMADAFVTVSKVITPKKQTPFIKKKPKKRVLQHKR